MADSWQQRNASLTPTRLTDTMHTYLRSVMSCLQYGNEVAAVAADSADVVEGVANMGVAMKYAQPTQVK